VFVVAEIGLNHSGHLSRALELVDGAAWAGASAIKLQTVDTDRFIAQHCPAPAHVAAASMRDFFRRFELDFDAHKAIVERARRHGLAVLSTPLSEHAVAMLERLELDAYKIASGDLTYHGLIAAAARTGRPVFLSTGMSEMDEIVRAVEAARANHVKGLAVLHCVSAYPAPVDSQNLSAVATLAQAFGVPTGLSDHGPGAFGAVIATALGASVYERHLMLAGDPDAIDAAVSSTPEELKAVVTAITVTRTALGDGIKRCLPVERANLVPSRRGLYAARKVRAGETISAEHVTILRPASALTPADLDRLIGQTAACDIDAGTPFTRTDISMAESA
jgi:sialic acid synthase SpsE